jgi:hypothetical protein
MAKKITRTPKIINDKKNISPEIADLIDKLSKQNGFSAKAVSRKKVLEFLDKIDYIVDETIGNSLSMPDRFFQHLVTCTICAQLILQFGKLDHVSFEDTLKIIKQSVETTLKQKED